MKNGYLSIIVILALSLLLMPLLAKTDKVQNNKVTSSDVSSNSNELKGDLVSVYIKEEKKVVSVPIEEYICGTVAAEMPAVYEKEALKAQAVCAYTYLCKKRESKKASDEYDITDDFKTDQAYINEQTRKDRWGEKYDVYEQKILEAVREIKDKIITYDGKIIFAAYHAISSGKTEDAKNVWGGEYPYLKAVSSEGDLLHKDYLSEKTVTETKFKEAFANKDVEFSENAKEYIGDIQKSESGTVLKIFICGKEFSGSEIRELFDLRSSNFDIKFIENSGFTFSVKGYGHGVGMSQNGANYLAQSGKNFEEIICHYYSGVKIESYSK